MSRKVADGITLELEEHAPCWRRLGTKLLILTWEPVLEIRSYTSSNPDKSFQLPTKSVEWNCGEVVPQSGTGV